MSQHYSGDLHGAWLAAGKRRRLPKRTGGLARSNAGRSRHDRSSLHNPASWPGRASDHGISATGAEALALSSTRLAFAKTRSMRASKLTQEDLREIGVGPVGHRRMVLDAR